MMPSREHTAREPTPSQRALDTPCASGRWWASALYHRLQQIVSVGNRKLLPFHPHAVMRHPQSDVPNTAPVHRPPARKEQGANPIFAKHEQPWPCGACIWNHMRACIRAVVGTVGQISRIFGRMLKQLNLRFTHPYGKEKRELELEREREIAGNPARRLSSSATSRCT